jgi:hypothetical protein
MSLKMYVSPVKRESHFKINAFRKFKRKAT